MHNDGIKNVLHERKYKTFNHCATCLSFTSRQPIGSFFLYYNTFAFYLELTVHGHDLNIHSSICLVLEKTVETLSGMVGKKPHTCLHLPNALYRTVSMWPRRKSYEEGIYSYFTARMVFTPYSLHKQIQIRTNKLGVPKLGTLNTASYGSVIDFWPSISLSQTTNNEITTSTSVSLMVPHCRTCCIICDSSTAVFKLNIPSCVALCVACLTLDSQFAGSNLHLLL
jgi:hypothetical protein